MTTTLDISGTLILDRTSRLQDDDVATCGDLVAPPDSEPCEQLWLR